ncbi:MAG: DUF86 domain-containing protein [Prevotellaceae bacterium]|jgi:uncharacterized protein with HEPN domain|nr:DUF86 domain-containing protein [Prevotellaceae bacterium]
MDNDIKKYLYDILESINSIEKFLDEKHDFSIYTKNKMLRRAIEREFEIIGEALNRIDKKHPNFPISSKQQIVGVRNRVIHGYDKIDDAIIWGIIIRHLPVLKREVTQLLNE